MHRAGSAVPTRTGLAKGQMTWGLRAWARRNAHRAQEVTSRPPLPHPTFLTKFIFTSSFPIRENGRGRAAGRRRGPAAHPDHRGVWSAGLPDPVVKEEVKMNFV